jgi:hypothetical protein
MKIKEFLSVLGSAAALLEDAGASERAQGLRAFAKAIDQLRVRDLDALLEVLAKVTLETHRR